MFAGTLAVVILGVLMMFYDLRKKNDEPSFDVDASVDELLSTESIRKKRAIDQVFQAYLQLYGKSYKNKETYQQRKKEFLRTQNFIAKVNKKAKSPVDVRLAHNHMSDWTQ